MSHKDDDMHNITVRRHTNGTKTSFFFSEQVWLPSGIQECSQSTIGDPEDVG